MQEIDQHVGSTVRWNLTKRIKIFNKYLQHSQIAKCNHLICRRHVTSSSYLKNFVSSMIFIVVKYLQNSQSFGNHRVENTIQIPSVNRRVEKITTVSKSIDCCLSRDNVSLFPNTSWQWIKLLSFHSSTVDRCTNWMNRSYCPWHGNYSLFTVCLYGRRDEKKRNERPSYFIRAYAPTWRLITNVNRR